MKSNLDKALKNAVLKVRDIVSWKCVVGIARLSKGQVQTKSIVVNPAASFINEDEIIENFEDFDPAAYLRGLLYFASADAMYLLSELDQDPDDLAQWEAQSICSFLLEPGIGISVVVNPEDSALEDDILQKMRE